MGKELRKLNRAELLELLVAQTERADRLTAELAEAKEQIRTREKLINQAGDLAEAATKLLQALELEPINVREAVAGPSAPVAKPVAKTGPATKPVAPVAKPTLTPQQLAVLQKNRDSLTPRQLQMLKQEEAIHYRLARQQADMQQKTQSDAYGHAKGSEHETKGIDISAIAAITSGIGAGKI